MQNNTSNICKISGNVNMVQCNSNYIMMWDGWQIDSWAIPYWINKDFINQLGIYELIAYISYRPKLIYE